MSSNNDHFSDDLFAETRMSFGDHLEDLRLHLIRALVGFAVAMVGSFFVGQYVVAFIAQPVETALVKFYDERAREFVKEIEKDPTNPINDKKLMVVEISAKEFQEALRQINPKLVEGVPAPADDTKPIVMTMFLGNPARFMYGMQEITRRLGKRPALTTLSPQEAIMVYFQVCIITGFVISSPWIFIQIWTFVAAGLYPHEKKYVHYYLPFSIFLFLAGVVLCQFFIIPKALEALLYFNSWMNLEPDFRLNEWLSFAIWTPVVVGICFQTPLVMLFLGKIGIFRTEDFVAKRKIALFVMLILAAVLSPTVDPVSLMLMWLPMAGLYELGIWMVRWSVPKSEFEEDEVPYAPEEAARTSGGDEPPLE